MNTPKFVLCYNRESMPGPFILCTDKPYYVGQLWTYDNMEKFVDKMNNNSFIAHVQVPGCMIIISFAGTLGSGKFITHSFDVKQGLNDLLQEMANFYITERPQNKFSKHLVR